MMARKSTPHFKDQFARRRSAAARRHGTGAQLRSHPSGREGSETRASQRALLAEMRGRALLVQMCRQPSKCDP
jgi:hypothetical protein